jgi:predicted GH43/DUF377 family glycosyl hydrolase
LPRARSVATLGGMTPATAGSPPCPRPRRPAPKTLGRSLLVTALALCCCHAWADEGTSSVDAGPYRTPYKYGKLVLKNSDAPGDFDSKLVDIPFVFSANGRFYMTYVGHDGVGYQTGLAESDDLVTWRKDGMILGRNPASPAIRYNIALMGILRNNDLADPGTLKKVNGHYLGVWNAYSEAGYEQGSAVLGLAWSDDLKHWRVGEPVLRPQDGAAWERGSLCKACLVEDGGTTYIFYNAKSGIHGRWVEQIGVATSRDLKTWTRYGGNPIIPNGAPGSWDDRYVGNPAVLRRGATWVVYYYGLSTDRKARDLLALGPDPFHLTKVNEVMLDAGPPGSVDQTYAHKPSVISYHGDLYHFYCAVSRSAGQTVRGISVARSRPWP